MPRAFGMRAVAVRRERQRAAVAAGAACDAAAEGAAGERLAVRRRRAEPARLDAVEIQGDRQVVEVVQVQPERPPADIQGNGL